MRYLPILLLAFLLLGFSACQKSTSAICPEACTNDTLLHKKRVLIIGIDGCRWDALQQASTPNMDKLMQDGKYADSVNRGPYTWSGPGWSSMLTGVWPNKHGVVDNLFGNNNLGNYPHFYCRMKNYSTCYKLGSFVHWGPINEQIADPCGQDITCTFNADNLVSEAARNYIRDCTMDVVFTHFDDADHAGHANGFHPSIWQYIQAIERIDSYCGQMLEAVYDRETQHNEEWLVIVSTDHGGKGNGQHGGYDNDPEVRNVFAIYRTPNMQVHGKIPTTTTLVDIAPTIMNYLSVPIDTLWSLDGNIVDLQ